MATVNLAFGPVDSYNKVHSTAVIRPRTTEDMTPTGTSAASTAAAIRNGSYGEFVQVTTDTNVYISIGASPVAEDGNASGESVLVLAGQTRDFALATGEKVAVITATL